MAETLISQAASPLNLQWTAGDPVNIVFTVVGGASLQGTYKAEVRKNQKVDTPVACELTVNTALSGVGNADCTFTLTLSEALSGDVLAGAYVWDLQKLNGITIFSGEVEVLGQVTRFP